MHAPVVGNVEVRKNPKSTTWYCATILDIHGPNIRVGFEDNIWPSRDVPTHAVRLCPKDTPSDDFGPGVDEVVEVRVNASDANPSGWALGRVKAIKKEFYFIAFEGKPLKGAQDLIVERSALRRVNNQEPIDPAKLAKRLIPVEEELHGWIRSQDSLGCLSHVQAKGGLLIAAAQNIALESNLAPEVLLVGETRAVDLGEKLLTLIHFKNQVEMQRFHEQREKLMERVAEMQKWSKSQHREVFTVDSQAVGKIIGKKGENIKQVRERHHVEVYVDDPELNDKSRAGVATITVTGTSAEAVQKAREELEYVTVQIPVPQEQVGWILGKGYQNMTEIARKTDLMSARFNDSTGSLELCGLRHQVEDAKLLISVHSEYLPVYKDMDEETHAIQQSFEELEGKGRKGKGGRGSSKGGGQGRGVAEDPGKASGKRGRGSGRDGRKGGK